MARFSIIGQDDHFAILNETTGWFVAFPSFDSQNIGELFLAWLREFASDPFDYLVNGTPEQSQSLFDEFHDRLVSCGDDDEWAICTREGWAVLAVDVLGEVKDVCCIEEAAGACVEDGGFYRHIAGCHDSLGAPTYAATMAEVLAKRKPEPAKAVLLSNNVNLTLIDRRGDVVIAYNDTLGGTPRYYCDYTDAEAMATAIVCWLNGTSEDIALVTPLIEMPVDVTA